MNNPGKCFVAILFLLLAPACATEVQPQDQGEVAEENVGQAESALTFNACACIGTSNITNCSGGVCESSRPTNLQDNYYCKKTDRVFQCTHYQTTYCRETGYLMHSMTCCSGHARYLGSDLYCTAN